MRVRPGVSSVMQDRGLGTFQARPVCEGDSRPSALAVTLQKGCPRGISSLTFQRTSAIQIWYKFSVFYY